MPQSDTTPEAREAQLAAYRAMGSARRLQLAFEVSERAREISIDGMMARHPELTWSEARLRVIRRLLGDALFEAAWSRHPEK